MSRADALRLLVPLALVQLVSIRAFGKYLAVGPATPYLLALGLCALLFPLILGLERWLGAWPKLLSLVTSRRFFVALGLTVIPVLIGLYLIADVRKNVGLGTDSDDAMIVGATNLLRHFDPYREPTYLHNALSPGPGWILLVAPLAASGAYALLAPSSLILFHSLLSERRGSRLVLLQATLTLLSGVGVWETMVIGSDVLSLGIVLAASLWAIERGWRTTWGFAALAVTYGLVLTGRILLPVVLPISGLYLAFRRGVRAAVTFSAGTLLVILATHLLFYWRADSYMPLHLVSKGSRTLELAHLSPAVTATVLGLLTVIGLRVGLPLLRSARYDNFVLATALGLSLPLWFAAFAELRAKKFDAALWETNYVVITIPLWIYYFVVASDRQPSSDAASIRTR